MRLALATCAGILATSAIADYADHQGVMLFTERPCTAAVAEIDQSFERYLGQGLAGLEDLSRAVASQGMAWGFVLGYDTAEGGLQGNEETTLVRFRKACAENPSATGEEILQGFSN